MSEKKWTIMIYLAGNNSLSEECVFALADMAASRPSSQVAIIAQLNTPVHDNTPLRINGGMSADQIHAKLKEALTKTNGTTESSGLMDSREKILTFVEDCKKDSQLEADHYMLVLSGHGSGTMGDFLRQDGKKPISLMDLRKLLQDIHNVLNRKLDVLGLDTCLMSMGEVAYILEKHVNVMIGAD